MVGLSVILEGYKDNVSATQSAQLIIKGSVNMTKNPPSHGHAPPPPPSSSLFAFSGTRNTPHLHPGSGFLDRCFLCKQKLSPSKDIFMYRGDKAFCSVECRCRQIFTDEEAEKTRRRTSAKNGCSLAAAMRQPQETSVNASSPSSPPCSAINNGF